MKKYHARILLGALLAVSAIAANAESVMPKTMQQGGGKGSMPPNHPAAVPANVNLTNSGKIVEILDSPQYSFLKVADAKGKTVWLAGYKGNFTKGATVKYSDGMTMNNFEAKSVKKTFDTIIFVDALEQVK